MKEELLKLRAEIEQNFKNLSDPNWVNGQLRNLEGKFAILNDVIKKLEEEENNAADKSK